MHNEIKRKWKFSLIFICIVTSLLIAVILWSIFSIKTYVGKASGVVSDEFKENIMNYTTGEIKKIYGKEGDKVNKGDKLIEINSFQWFLYSSNIYPNSPNSSQNKLYSIFIKSLLIIIRKNKTYIREKIKR